MMNKKIFFNYQISKFIVLFFLISSFFLTSIKAQSESTSSNLSESEAADSQEAVANSADSADSSPAVPPSVTIETPQPNGQQWQYENSNSSSPFVRPLYSVGVLNMIWTNPNRSMQINGQVYYPVESTERCPIVIYSHGLGGSPVRFAYLGNMWASRGIVSIFIHHPETDESQWRGKIRALSELRELYRRYWSARDRALAISFVIDRLYEMQDQPGTISEKIDVSRIGVAGNDLGALGALLVAGQLPPDNGTILKDDRITAVLALSPTVYCSQAQGKAVYEKISAPFMSVSGTNDDGIVGMTKAWQRRIPFDSMADNDRFHVTLNGGDHLVYSGHLRTRKQAGDQIYQNAIRNVSLVFWAAYLLNDGTAKEYLKISSPAMLSSISTLESKIH